MLVIKIGGVPLTRLPALDWGATRPVGSDPARRAAD